MATRAKSPAVAIRPARASDLDDIAAIERSVFNDPWSRRSFAELVDARQVLFLVASDAGAVVGYAIVLTAGVESELANLAVSRITQRHGLGRRLLAECLDQARDRGCKEMFLEVRASNEAALQLYIAAGFKAVGRRARYYARPIEDAIVMKVTIA
jgi:ribosomal-protein-alanine N-acetyltransferase